MKKSIHSWFINEFQYQTILYQHQISDGMKELCENCFKFRQGENIAQDDICTCAASEQICSDSITTYLIKGGI